VQQDVHNWETGTPPGPRFQHRVSPFISPSSIQSPALHEPLLDPIHAAPLPPHPAPLPPNPNQVYIIDGWDNTPATVAAIKARGAFPVCYFSAGTFEEWRPDAGKFAAADKGKPLAEWPGEAWVDVRSPGVRAIVQARMEMCRDKGFLAVDPDNVDGYSNDNGLGLTAADQLDFNRWAAGAAHALGLGAGLKNDVGQVADLVDAFDFFANE
jgi:hypothetical protein